MLDSIVGDKPATASNKFSQLLYQPRVQITERQKRALQPHDINIDAVNVLMLQLKSFFQVNKAKVDLTFVDGGGC